MITNELVVITQPAIDKLIELVAEEGGHVKIRAFVQGGGCSGFQYGFTFDEIINEDDFEIPAGSSSVLIDAMSAQYLTGATIDFIDDLSGTMFKIINPNAETTCGCGSSFNPY